MIGNQMTYQKSAAYYDAIYSFKDYAHEAELLHRIIQTHKRSVGNQLLEVACGTGAHLKYLNAHYQIEGLDLSEDMLALARQKHPTVPFHQGDMRNFDLGRRFDGLICLFSSIGYMQTVSDLQMAIATMARHIVPGGVLIVEPWFSPDQFVPGTLHGNMMVNTADLKICRMNVSEVQGRLSIMMMHHLIGTQAGVEHFVERHEMGLFTHAEYLEAFVAAHVQVTHDSNGLDDRGLYIGTPT